MPSNRYRGPPMTLANMRAQGVRSLWVVCDLCDHEAVLNVDDYGDAVPVPALGPRMCAPPAESWARMRGRIGRSARRRRALLTSNGDEWRRLGFSREIVAWDTP